MDMARICPGSVRDLSHCNVVASLLAILRDSLSLKVREGEKAEVCEGFGDF